MALDVLFCDNHLLAVAKPAGMPVVPDDSGDLSLFDMARSWVEVEFDKPGRAFLGVVHRLDRPVSGVVLFARTSKAAARLTEQFREQQAAKTYIAICHGLPRQDDGKLVHWLSKDERRNRVTASASKRGNAKRAVTQFRALLCEGKQTLVELIPETGRPHQLRAAMASIDMPVVGDVKYGAPKPLPDKTIALHARELTVAHPTTKKATTFSCQPPVCRWWALARQGHGRK